MAVTIVASKPTHRHDIAGGIDFTIGGYVAATQYRFIASDQLYDDVATGTSPVNQEFLNRTELFDAVIRRMNISTAALTSIVDGAISGTNRYSKTGGTGDGWHGAQFATAASGVVGVELKPIGVTSLSTYGVYLQSSASPNLGFLDATVEHALVFGQNGVGQIYEGGVSKMRFEWRQDDRGYIELRDGIIRYWQIRSDTDVRLLRATRTTMAYPVQPTFLLYHEAGTADVVLFLGEEASTSIQIYGVLNWDLQDLQNPQQIEPLGERSIDKGKGEEVTYFTDEKNLITLSLNLEWRLEELYQEFREFFQYHDNFKEFIFIDKARDKLLLQPIPSLADNEMFAKFTGSWKDNPLGADLFGASVDLKQIVDPPTVPFGF